MLGEFRKFIMRGNVLDLAVGVMIGAAFGAVVTSLVDDIIMPPIGAAIGGIDFSSIFVNLSGQPIISYAAAKEAGLPVIGIGAFINALIGFMIVAFVLFLLIRAFNQYFDRMVEAAPPPPSEVLLAEIRDLLKAQQVPAAAVASSPQPITSPQATAGSGL